MNINIVNTINTTRILDVPFLKPNWVVPPNTPKEPLINLNFDYLKGIYDMLKGLCDGISSTINYITHPILIWNGLVDVSYWICLVVAMGGVIIYIFTKSKKSITYSKVSIASYILIRVLNLCIIA